MIKTSLSDPIRVDFLPAEAVGLAGRIGMTFAPGKIDWGTNARWERDLQTDLERIRHVYDCSVLVSLIEPFELTALQIPELWDCAQRIGFAVLRLPIVDGCAPRSNEQLADLVDRILAHARSSRNVAIHCRGGLGRTGLVAACCLIARGFGTQVAIDTVRRARAGTIETPEQQQCVGSFVSHRPPLARGESWFWLR